MPQVEPTVPAQKAESPWIPFYNGGKLALHGIDIEWILQVTVDNTTSSVLLLINGDKRNLTTEGKPINVVNKNGQNCVVQGRNIVKGSLEIKVDCLGASGVR